MKKVVVIVGGVALAPLLLIAPVAVALVGATNAQATCDTGAQGVDTGAVAAQVESILNGGDGGGVSVPGLTSPKEQIPHARTIQATGVAMKVPVRGQIVALATALQESGLRNLDYGDRDSLGLFQQRPSMGWGTPEQVRDPVYASTKFYEGLLKVSGWESMTVTQAAQAVQLSGFPDALHALRHVEAHPDDAYHLCCRRPLDVARLLDVLVSRAGRFSVDFFLPSAQELIPRAVPWLHRAVTVFVNLSEYRLLAEAVDISALPELVITDGPRGARVLVHGAPKAASAPPVPVDGEVTGAGDTLAGTYLARRHAGADPDIALSAGVAAASAHIRSLPLPVPTPLVTHAVHDARPTDGSFRCTTSPTDCSPPMTGS
ncbi:carbohydrate kinase family protein [Streptomyces sp. NPDC052179]|uniref:carbohydrate kinase family protein n=1 Tax=Streptomyces sp. NPDC052179 TaxID=3155680 RepID=UPI00342C80B3